MKPGDLIAWRAWTWITVGPELREYIAIYLDENISRSAYRVLVSGRIRYIPATEVKVINEVR